MSKRTILGVTLVSVSLAGAAACGGNGVSLGNDGGQSGGGASAGNGSAGKGGTIVLPQGGSSAGTTSKAGAGGTSSAGNGGTPTGGTTTTGGSNTAGSTSGGASSKGCSNPTPLDGGWEACDGGVVHRPTPGMCKFTPSQATLPPSQGQDQCNKDSDCTAMPYGYCQLLGDFNTPSNRCQYGCVADSDCAQGLVCVCSGPGAARQVGSCEGSTNCKSDADCSGGSLCTDYWSQPGCPMRDFSCQTPQDECASDKDCPTGLLPMCGAQDGHRKCMGIVCQADIASP